MAGPRGARTARRSQDNPDRPSRSQGAHLRKVLVVVGIALAIAGPVVMVGTIFPNDATFAADSPEACSGCPIGYNIYAASPSATGGTAAHLAWSSPALVRFVALTCTKAVTSSELQSDQSPSQFNDDCGANATIANSSGTGGSESFNIPSGGSLVYFAVSSSAHPPNVTADLSVASPLLGLSLAGVGALCLVFAWFPRPKPASARPPNPPPAARD